MCSGQGLGKEASEKLRADFLGNLLKVECGAHSFLPFSKIARVPEAYSFDAM